jgi:hypothetical protein
VFLCRVDAGDGVTLTLPLDRQEELAHFPLALARHQLNDPDEGAPPPPAAAAAAAAAAANDLFDDGNDM